MPATGNHAILVLWEHEIRVAGKALRVALDLVKAAPDADTRTPEQQEAIGDATQVFVEAAAAALLGTDDENAAITISAAADMQKRHGRAKKK